MRQLLTSTLFMLSLMLLVSCEKKQNFDIRVFGHVYDMNSITPVVGAKVYLAASDWGPYFILDSTITNEQGQYTFIHDNPNEYGLCKLKAISKEHHGSQSIRSPAEWYDRFNPNLHDQKRMDLFLWPKAWLRVHAVKTSNASFLFINPTGENNRHFSTSHPDTVFTLSVLGNDSLTLPSFQVFSTYEVPMMLPFYAPGHDTTDFYLEW